jgi:hypothetical protein
LTIIDVGGCLQQNQSLNVKSNSKQAPVGPQTNETPSTSVQAQNGKVKQASKQAIYKGIGRKGSNFYYGFL